MGRLFKAQLALTQDYQLNLLFWFRLFWLENQVPVSRLKTILYRPEIL